MVSMEAQREGATVTIVTNNAFPVGVGLMCVFGRFGTQQATVVEPGKLTCVVSRCTIILGYRGSVTVVRLHSHVIKIGA